MNELRTIEIDFDVHQRIELARRGFAETPNTVLRRLLNISGIEPTPKPAVTSGERSWSNKGVMLPHGTKLRMEYNGRVHTGFIENGDWIVEGKRYSSPSAAAGGVALTKAGKSTSLDGWVYWDVRRPSDTDWVRISALRKHNE